MGDLKNIKIDDLELNANVNEDLENVDGAICTTSAIVATVTLTLATIADKTRVCNGGGTTPPRPGGDTEYCY